MWEWEVGNRDEGSEHRVVTNESVEPLIGASVYAQSRLVEMVGICPFSGLESSAPLKARLSRFGMRGGKPSGLTVPRDVNYESY